jgi:hypothetical protein
VQVFSATIAATSGSRTTSAGNYNATGELTASLSLGAVELSLRVTGQGQDTRTGLATMRLRRGAVLELIEELQARVSLVAE